MAKRKKKSNFLSRAIISVVTILLFLIGAMCFVLFYDKVGVSLAASKTFLNNETSLVLTFMGLNALIGGKVSYSTLISINGNPQTDKPIVIENGPELALNYPLLIGAGLLLIGFLIFIVAYNKKWGQLFAFLTLGGGSALMLCSGLIFGQLNIEAVKNLTAVADFIGSGFAFIDWGALVFGAIGALITVFAFINMIVRFIKN